jgi:hypothetical protein
MLQVCLAADVKGNPAGIGDPMVLLCQTLVQERIADWPGKWDVNDPAHVYVSYFRVSKSEFPTYKTMWMHSHVRPGGHLGFERLQVVHVPHSIGSVFDARKQRLDSATALGFPSKPKWVSLTWWGETHYMQHAFGREIRQTLDDVCDPARLAVIVYDMQVGIVKQIGNGQ